MGSFDGVFTTTWDIMAGGVGTQAVMVTATDGDNVGTDPGQVPPVGTVYNIMYIGDYVYLYSSMPSPSGDVVSLTVTTPDVESFRKTVQAAYQSSEFAKTWPKGLVDRINAVR